MGTSLDTRPAPETTRLPGDFHRHSHTGAPMVPDPERRNKIKGKKAELLAMCEQHGIEPPAKATNKKLIELLEAAGAGGPAPMVQYGRPSSFGKQIENSTNLQKWSERMVGWGVALMSIEGEDFDGADTLNPELDEDRSALDGLAVEAKRRAKAGLAAERGTHTHELTEDFDQERDPIERMKAGEELGLPIEVQRALIDAWEQMQSEGYFEVLEVEAKCVDDRWRLAGTTDRIVRLKRDITFVMFGGELVTVPEGTVLILDIKTGQLRLTPKGEPMYWHGYAIQIASYAQSVPFDPDTGARSEWPFEIDQKWAIIAHLDVLAALDGEAVCRLILVDLETGRAAGDLVVAAKAWEKRKDVFSIIGASPDEVVFTVPVEIPETAVATYRDKDCCPSCRAESGICGPPDSPYCDDSWHGPTTPITPAITEENPCSESSRPERSSPALTPESPSSTPASLPFSISDPERSPSSVVDPSSAASSPTPSPAPSAPQSTPSPIMPTPVMPAPPAPTPPPSPTNSVDSSTGTGTNTTTDTPASAAPGTPSQPAPMPVFPPIGTAKTEGSNGSAPSTNSATASPVSSNSSGTTPNVPTDLTEQLPGEIVDYSEQHTEDLKALAHEIAEWPEHVRVGLARSWPDPDVLPYPGDVRDGNAVWTADQMPLIQTLLAAAGAPFTAVNADPVPPRERAFVTAPPRHSDLEPVERPTLELLTDAVRQSGQVERINGWLTEAHQAGVPFSPLAMPNVGNYERLRFALRLAEFAEDDQQLGFAIACPDGQSTMTLGQTIGEMTGADAQAAFNRIEALSTGRSALLYSDDGHPIIVNQVSAP